MSDILYDLAKSDRKKAFIKKIEKVFSSRACVGNADQPIKDKRFIIIFRYKSKLIQKLLEKGYIVIVLPYLIESPTYTRTYIFDGIVCSLWNFMYGETITEIMSVPGVDILNSEDYIDDEECYLEHCFNIPLIKVCDNLVLINYDGCFDSSKIHRVIDRVIRRIEFRDSHVLTPKLIEYCRDHIKCDKRFQVVLMALWRMKLKLPRPLLWLIVKWFLHI